MPISGKITRYSENDYTDYDGEKIVEIRDSVDTSESDTDKIYEVKEGDTLRDIAYMVYDDSRLYWIIAEFNKIINPYEKLQVGRELRYPTLKRIMEEIF